MTIEQRLETMAIAQVRTADALESIAKSLEKLANPAHDYLPVPSKAQIGLPPAVETGKPVEGKIQPAVTKKVAPKEVKNPVPAKAEKSEPTPGPSVDLGLSPATQVFTSEDVANVLRRIIAKDKNQAKAIDLMVKYGANKAKPLVADVASEYYNLLIEEANNYLGV